MRAKNIKFWLLESWLGGSSRLEGIRGYHIPSTNKIEAGFELQWSELGELIKHRAWRPEDLLIMDPEQVFWIKKLLGVPPLYSAVLNGYLGNACVTPNGLDAFSCQQLAHALDNCELSPFDLFVDAWYVSCVYMDVNATGAELEIYLDMQSECSGAAHLVCRQNDVREGWVVDHHVFLDSSTGWSQIAVANLQLAAFQMNLVPRR